MDNPPKEIGGILYLYDEYFDTESELPVTKYRVIDDKNLRGDTMGKRRLQLKATGAKMAKLRTAIYFIGDLIKYANPNVYFVDNNGVVFKYIKTTYVKLQFKKIIKALPVVGGTGTVIEVEGIPSRFKTLYSLKPHERVAGLLKAGSSYILYGIYDQIYDNTIRKI